MKQEVVPGKVPNGKPSVFMRLFKWIEVAGNKLPDPFAIFLALIVIIVVLSWIFNAMGVQIKNPIKNEVVGIKSLVSKEGVKYILENLVSNFSGFAPLGLVLTMMLGIGLAEQSGLMSTFMKRFILGAPEKLLIFAIFLIGICGNLASDAAAIIVPGLAGAMFLATKRNPLVGVVAGYAAACSGFSANILIAGTDVLVASITQEAARIIKPGIVVSPLVNYYFMVVSTFVLAVTGTWITTKFVIKMAGGYEAEGELAETSDSYEVTAQEKKGLRSAGITTLVYWGLVIAALIPINSPLRGNNGSIISSPFIKGIVPFLLLWFTSAGIAYGVKTGIIKSIKDVTKLMSKAIQGMSSYIVLVFVMAQFISFFNWTNMGFVLSVKLADMLKATQFTGVGMVVVVVLITMAINLFIGSASAKWALLAPIFVPMFMLLNYSPAFAQLAYRIGDSVSNTISPLSPYFVIVLGFMQKYKKDVGIGNFFSLALPYVIGIGFVWILLMIAWFLLNIPIGPGTSIYM